MGEAFFIIYFIIMSLLAHFGHATGSASSTGVMRIEVCWYGAECEKTRTPERYEWDKPKVAPEIFFHNDGTYGILGCVVGMPCERSEPSAPSEQPYY